MSYEAGCSASSGYEMGSSGCDASDGYYNPPSSPAVSSSSGGYYNPSSGSSVWTTSSSRNYNYGYGGSRYSYDDDCNCGSGCEKVKCALIICLTTIGFIVLIYTVIWANTS